MVLGVKYLIQCESGDDFYNLARFQSIPIQGSIMCFFHLRFWSSLSSVSALASMFSNFGINCGVRAIDSSLYLGSDHNFQWFLFL